MDLDKEQSLNANWYVGDLGWYFFLNSCWTSEQVKHISCAVRSEILKFKSEDIEGQEQRKVAKFMYSSFYLI